MMHRRQNVLVCDMCVVSCVGVGMDMVVGVGVGVGVWVWVVVVGVGVDVCVCGRVTFLHTDLYIHVQLVWTNETLSACVCMHPCVWMLRVLIS